VAAAILASAPAQSQTNASIAEQLFVEAKTLMRDGKLEAACEKFSASYELDRSATGTLLNLALCHEATNKPASAWGEFRQVAAESAGKRADRVALAREHAEKLEPTLPRLRIVVPEQSRTGGLRIVLDKKQPIAAAVWNSNLPVDPGKHAVEASAPGKNTRIYEFTVANDPTPQNVTVEPLSDAPAGEGTKETAPPPTRGEIPAAPTPGESNSLRTIGFVVGGVGIVGIGAGLVAGLIANGKNSDAKALCPDDLCADPGTKDRASRLLKSADTAATTADIAVAVGAVLVAGGVVLVLTNGSKSASTVSVRPGIVSRDGASILLQGAM
jgi:hypothetical protein